MVLFDSLTKSQKKAAARKRKQQQAFLSSPRGMARTARKQGRKVFQFLEVITETKANVAPMIGAWATDESGVATGLQGKMGRESSSAIEQIENEGWEFVDAGYVFQQTGAESRDKFLASGQQEAVAGRVLGIYTFRIRGSLPATAGLARGEGIPLPDGEIQVTDEMIERLRKK